MASSSVRRAGRAAGTGIIQSQVDSIRGADSIDQASRLEVWRQFARNPLSRRRPGLPSPMSTIRPPPSLQLAKLIEQRPTRCEKKSRRSLEQISTSAGRDFAIVPGKARASLACNSRLWLDTWIGGPSMTLAQCWYSPRRASERPERELIVSAGPAGRSTACCSGHAQYCPRLAAHNTSSSMRLHCRWVAFCSITGQIGSQIIRTRPGQL